MVVVTGREPDSRRPDGAMSSSDAEDDFLEPATPTATQAGHALPLLPQEFPEVVPLNIGGAHFTTRLSTLRRYEDDAGGHVQRATFHSHRLRGPVLY